jgi:single-strand DNA-binding protein
MSNLNRVMLIGNLTRDPELRTVQTGTHVCELGIAINRSWTEPDGQKQEEVTFLDVTFWGRIAENAAKFLAKGRSVYIEGRLQLDTWQDAQSGQERSKLKVVGERLQFLGGAAASAKPSDGLPADSGNQEPQQKRRYQSGRAA